MSSGQHFFVVFLCGFQLISGFDEPGLKESSGANEKLTYNGFDQNSQRTPEKVHLLHRLERSGFNASYKLNGSRTLNQSDFDVLCNVTSQPLIPHHLSLKHLIGRLEKFNSSSTVKESSWNQTIQVVQSVMSPVTDYFDWRVHGGVSPVKDQGQCDACWAFSAVANIESQLWIRGYQRNLSEQFLIDCNGMGAGCSAAGIVNTFADIITNIGGVLSTLDYPPYIQHKAQCRWNHNSALLVPVVGLERVEPLNEAQMVQKLLKHGPLSAAINDAMMIDPHRDPLSIDQPTEQQCPSGKEHLNHAVLVVGYTVYRGQDGKEIPYWIIKNSWGEAWGDHGFYYLQRGINACGIARDVSYAIIPSLF